MPRFVVRSPLDTLLLLVTLLALAAYGCAESPPATSARVAGYVEATDVQVAAEVGGRLLELLPAEGDRVAQGDLVARIDSRDVELSLARARAERDQAQAQLRLLQAGARLEDVRQAQAQAAASQAETAAAQVELDAAEADLRRFEMLLQNNSGSEKQRDDAATRRDIARQRVTSAQEHARAAREGIVRLEAGARPEEVSAARARVAVTTAQIAALEKSREDATVRSPIGGVVTERLLDPGEMAAPGAPLIIVTDLDRAWAEVFVDEPQVPRLQIGQAVTLFTDAGGAGIPGTLTYISPKAEFTPRNVQTAEDRSRLVYRVKISVDNRQGILKQGMPVEAEMSLR